MEIDHELHDEIRRTANISARKWVGVIDSEDLEQGVWTRLLESDYFDRWALMSPLARRRVLLMIGDQIASGERESYAVFTGQVYYGSDEVRALLERGALMATCGEDTGVTVLEQYRPATDGSEGGSFCVTDLRRVDREQPIMTLTESIDLRSAYEHLTDTEKVTLHSRFVRGEIPGIGEDRKHITRAVDYLTRAMNRNYRNRADEWVRR